MVQFDLFREMVLLEKCKHCGGGASTRDISRNSAIRLGGSAINHRVVSVSLYLARLSVNSC